MEGWTDGGMDGCVCMYVYAASHIFDFGGLVCSASSILLFATGSNEGKR